MTSATVPSAARPRGLRRWVFPWTAGFQRSWLSADLVAGIALGVVMIPQGMAYAELAGVPAVAGLYATMAAIIGYAILGSSRQLVVGPDSSTSTLVAAALLSIVGAGAAPEQILAGAAFMAVVAGVLLLLGGVVKAGVIANFLSKPVLVGYLNALALTIIIKQLPKILGYKVEAENLIAATDRAGAQATPNRAAVAGRRRRLPCHHLHLQTLDPQDPGRAGRGRARNHRLRSVRLPGHGAEGRRRRPVGPALLVVPPDRSCRSWPLSSSRLSPSR